jgi:hypothetical protein
MCICWFYDTSLNILFVYGHGTYYEKWILFAILQKILKFFTQLHINREHYSYSAAAPKEVPISLRQVQFLQEK